MTKKEEEPRNERSEMNTDKKQGYNPDITPEDKETLNNQSHENKGNYFKNRDEPIDYAGADLDLPTEDQDFNQTANEAQDVEKERRPKESANSNDNIESQSNIIYKGEKAEKYTDPSEKTRKDEDEK